MCGYDRLCCIHSIFFFKEVGWMDDADEIRRTRIRDGDDVFLTMHHTSAEEENRRRGEKNVRKAGF